MYVINSSRARKIPKSILQGRASHIISIQQKSADALIKSQSGSTCKVQLTKRGRALVGMRWYPAAFRLGSPPALSIITRVLLHFVCISDTKCKAGGA